MENWKDVPGYENYQVSDRGRILSKSYGVLKPKRNKKGYFFIRLSKDGVKKTKRVHILVMLAFVGPRPDGFHTNHLDGDKLNNSLNNLEYCTPRENYEHAIRMGLAPALKPGGGEHSLRGEDHPSAKLTEEMVREARKIHSSGEMGFGKLAGRYGVGYKAIRNAVKGRSWKHVT